MSNPLISIIIPTFNREELLPQTLDSILSQDYQNWECVIVDDGSTDNSEQIVLDYVARDSRFRFFKRPEHLPKSGNSCRNYGFEMSRGTYVNFFDSDDVMLPQFLSSRVDLIKENKTKVVFATYDIVDDQLSFQRKSNFTIQSYLLKDYIFWRFPIITHSGLFLKSYLEEIKKKNILFDPSIRRGQETHFFLSALKNISREEFEYVEESSFLYRLHDKSITAGTQTYNKLYKESAIKTWAKAYSVGKELNDTEFLQKAHLHLIITLFEIIKNGDLGNLPKFNQYYLNSHQELSFLQKIEIKIFSLFLSIIKLTPKLLEKRWINFIKK